jgi:hypothetical protein
MKRGILFFSIISLALTAGCTKAARYSHDEIRDFPQPVQERIKNNEVAVGMTKVQVRYAWGGPHSVNVLQPADDGKERIEWVYEKLHFFKSRLIFTDGKLTEIISNEPGFAK